MARKQKGVRFDEVTLALLSDVTEFARAVTGVHVTETALMERFIVDGMANYMTRYCLHAKEDPEWAAKCPPFGDTSFADRADELAGITLSHATAFGLQEKNDDYIRLLNELLNNRNRRDTE